jgi:uncharacterized protein YndB with AHSA1/START domain
VEHVTFNSQRVFLLELFSVAHAHHSDSLVTNMNRKNPGNYTVRLHLTVTGGIEQAYDAFTMPKLLSKWFTKEDQADLQVGGWYSNSDKDKGTFLVLDHPRHVRFTWDNEEHCPGTLVDITFTSIDSKNVEASLEHSAIKDQVGYDDMIHGWSWTLDSFKSYLETGKPIGYDEWLKAATDSV